MEINSEYTNIFNQVVELIRANLSYKGEIVEITSFTNDLGIDSLQVMDLMSTVEDKFNIYIPFEELVGVKTVKDLVVLIQAELKAHTI